MKSLRELAFLLASFLLCSSLAWAQPNDVPAAPEEPEVRDDGVINFRVEGRFQPSEATARESALHVAQQRIRSWLSQQQPPIQHGPSMQMLRRSMVVKQESLAIEEIGEDKLYKMTLVVSLRLEDQRVLRGLDRVSIASWVLGGVFGILLIIALGVRLEEWSKGYLTRWLIVGATAVIILLTGFWWWIR